MNALSIFRRDFAAYLTGYTGWIIIASVLFIDGLLFNVYAMGGGEAKYSHEVLSQFFHQSSGLVMAAVKEHGTQMIPVDSEHNGAHQCLRAGRREEGPG